MGLLRLRASNTHLYPGARMLGEDAGRAPRRGDRVLIQFADLGTARGRVEKATDRELELDMQSHRTERGTTVAAKRWIVAQLADGEGARWRVVRRAPN